MDENKFKALLLEHRFADAKKLLEDSELTAARRQELARMVDERRKRFWQDLFEEDLYAGIPATIVFVQLLLWAVSVLSGHVFGPCILSWTIFAGMLWFYIQKIRPLWKRLKRPGGMSIFDRDKKWLGRVLWWFGLAWSLLFAGIILYMATMAQ